MAGIALSESSDEELDGLPNFLSLSTIQAAVLGVILAQAGQLKLVRISTTGKLYLPFGLGGHAVTSCGTIAPGPDGSQHVAVAHGASALQNQRTVHAAVRPDDETYFDSESRFDRNQQRIRRGQRFRRLGIFAARARAHMRDVTELGGARWSLENLVFAAAQDCLARARSWNRHGSRAGSGKCED